MPFRVKRVYDPPSPADGKRILVDRLWPRGLSKQAAALDEWMRDLSPSTELRRWYDHDASRFEEFVDRFRTELNDHRDTMTALREAGRARVVTLLYGTRSREHNNAVALKRLLEE